jgi:YidC/Oxa1 family membrane protein insertase
MFSFIWHTFFFDPVYNSLVFFIDIFPGGDVGLAIVATVFLVKTILLPVSIKAAKTQRIMKEIEPQLKELKETHKDDREKQAKEMMGIYKTAGMNPFASIFLIFLQIPLLISMYFGVVSLYPPVVGGEPIEEVGFLSVFSGEASKDIVIKSENLYSFVAVPAESNRFFLNRFDITEKSLILAIVVAITQFLVVSLTMPKVPPRKEGAKPDMKEDFMRNMQVQMKYVMPIIIGVVAYSISAAIALYFLVSNVTALLQEIFVRKHR